LQNSGNSLFSSFSHNTLYRVVRIVEIGWYAYRVTLPQLRAKLTVLKAENSRPPF